MTIHRGDRILVPLDGSKNAENAIPLAGSMARVFSCKIEFLQVHEDEEVDPESRAHAADLFKSYALERAGRAGIDTSICTASLVDGRAAAAILDAADVPNTGAIVLASHGRGGFRTAFFGSVADRVIRGSRIPILVVPGVGGPPTEISHILVTLDGSGVAERALEPARAIAKALTARLSLVEAYSLVPPLGVAYVYYPPDVPQEIEKAARDYIKAVAHEGEQALIVQGDATAAIVRTATDLDVDLVVMSSHGKDFSRRFILGSTTDRVMHDLHRPLLIIPPEKD